MKPAIEVLFETCAHALGRAVPPRTLAEFQEQLHKDRIMREGVRAVCDAMEKYAAQAIAPLQETLWKLRLELAELQKEPVIAE